MALVTADYIKPIKMLGGGSIPVMELKKASATTLARGCVVIATSGLVVTATDGPTTGTILGVTCETGDSGKTTVHVVPALPNIVWEVATATGDSGATTTIADSNLFVGYGVAVNSSIWYVDVGDSSDVAMALIKRLDADSTAWAHAEAVFIDSFWSKI